MRLLIWVMAVYSGAVIHYDIIDLALHGTEQVVIYRGDVYSLVYH